MTADATPPTVTPRLNAKGEPTSWQVCFSYTCEGKRVRVREKLPGVGPQDSQAAVEAAAVAFWRSRLAQAEQAQAAWTLAEAGYDLPRVGELARKPLREIAALWVASLEARKVRPGTITARRKCLARAPQEQKGAGANQPRRLHFISASHHQRRRAFICRTILTAALTTTMAWPNMPMTCSLI
jgi:hypothetical protein